MGDVHLPATSPSSSLVLANLDLLYAVFTFVPPASNSRDSYLARCATVCRTFHEPAIRVLWRNLSSLLPLWNLLAPSDAPFSADYFSTTKYDVLEYLQKVRKSVYHTISISHEIVDHFCATVPRPNTMGPFSAPCRPCPWNSASWAHGTGNQRCQSSSHPGCHHAKRRGPRLPTAA